MSADFAPWRDAYAAVNGLRLHYLDWGNHRAPPLLFLHGLSSHAHTFDPFVPLLRPFFHVLALDQRGHGESDWDPDGRYDEEHYVSDLEELAAGLRLRRLVLIGHSLGARNAWSFAARHPRRLSRLVLVDLGPEMETQGARRLRSREVPDSFVSVDDAFGFMREANPRPSDDMVRLRVLHNLKRDRDGRWTWRYDLALRPGAP